MSEKKHGTSSSGRPISSADQTKRNVLASAYKSDSEKRPKSTTVGRTRKMIENSRGVEVDACDSDQVNKKVIFLFYVSVLSVLQQQFLL